MSPSPDSLTFAHPVWLLLLAAIPVLILCKVAGDTAKERGVRRMVAASLRPQLVFGERPGLAWAVFALELGGVAFIAAALARPQFGFVERAAVSEGRNVLIAIDTSRSMLATDLEPNRLDRAKLAAQHLVDALSDDHVGVIAFAGGAHVHAPPTIDHAAVQETIDQLGIDSVPRGGTNIASAIKLALERFEKNAAERHALVIFTDGDDLEGFAVDAAKRAGEKGVTIITVGVGSAAGSIIPETDPLSREQFVRDRNGKIVMSRLDIESLEKIAFSAHGIFINLHARSVNTDVVKNMLQQLDRSEFISRFRRVPNELYQWPLGMGLLLLALGFAGPLLRRRRAFLPAPATAGAATFLAMLAIAPGNTRAETPESEAWNAYQKGEFERAADLYRAALGKSGAGSSATLARMADAFRGGTRNRHALRFGLGSSAFKAGDLETAMDAFSRTLLSDDVALRERSHYNLGGTLYRRGEQLLQPPSDPNAPKTPVPFARVLDDWGSAVLHYKDTLALNPHNTSASRNLKFVEERIRQLRKEQQRQREELRRKKKEEDSKRKEEESQEKKNENEDTEGKPPEKENPGEDEKSNNEDGGEEKTPEKAQEGGQESEPDTRGDSPDRDDTQKDESRSSNAAGEESAGDPKAGEQQKVTEDRAVNPETGYSKETARHLLRTLSDEQLDIKPIGRRARRSHYDDW